MRPTRLRTPLVALALVLLSFGLLPPLGLAQSDEARFAELLAQRDGLTSLAGPFFGELVQQEGFSTAQSSGVATESFSATATFENPATPGNLSWDFGFLFHLTDDASQQVAIDSDGNWYYSPYPEGTLSSGFAPMVNSDPRATNTVDLIVDGTTAYLGINGGFVSTIALPPPVASDVQVGTGFFTGTTAAGRPIGYFDFQVWPLDGAREPIIEVEETPSSNIVEIAVTPELVETPQAEAMSDAEAFDYLLEVQAEAAPIAGPFNANLKEEQDRVAQSWAGVDVADFHAHATFAVPQTTSETPWDVGFTFSSSPDGPFRIVVDSLGNWYYSVGSAGPSDRGTVTDIETSVGSANTIDLFVADQTLVFGVNGNFVAVIDLPSDITSGDVAAGSAFYSDQTLPDRVIGFRDFAILPFDPDVLGVPDRSVVADMLVGTASFGDDFVPGRVTGYKGLSVWEIA